VILGRTGESGASPRGGTVDEPDPHRRWPRLGDIKPNIDLPELDRLISEVIDKAGIVERDVRGRDGRWYSLRMRPHASTGNKTGGVLIALLDIDAMKRGFEQVRVSRDEALAERDLSATLLDLSGALIVVRDPDGAITGFNAACQEASDTRSRTCRTGGSGISCSRRRR